MELLLALFLQLVIFTAVVCQAYSPNLILVCDRDTGSMVIYLKGMNLKMLRLKVMFIRKGNNPIELFQA